MQGALLDQGRTAEIYAWGGTQVLKLFHAYMSDTAVQYEHHISRLIYEAGVSAPAVEAQIVEVDGRKGLIYERIGGVSMFHQLTKTPWLVRRLAHQMAELHRSIHAHMSADLPSQRQQFQNRIQAAPRLTDGEKRRVLDYLDSLPDGEAVCHGDFHPDNIMITAHEVVALDWTNAVRGNALADVARTSLMLSSGRLPPHMGLGRQLVTRFARQVFHDAYLHRYCYPAGAFSTAVSVSQIRAWFPVVAAARLIEGIAEEEGQLITLIQSAL